MRKNEINIHTFDELKADVLAFKKSSPTYKSTTWLASSGNGNNASRRNQFVDDYLKSRGQDPTHFQAVYDAMYIMMCRNWKPLGWYTEHEVEDARNMTA